MNIDVSYDGKYPSACYGTLIIKVDGEEIYNKKGCCCSSGFILEDDYDSEAVEGELYWEDASLYSKEIQKTVEEKLSETKVCCGGCII